MRTIIFLLTIIISVEVCAANWFYRQSKCDEFRTSCQDCVVEFAIDNTEPNGRNPCGYCPELPLTQRCQVMNAITGKCSKGKTYIDTCPIEALNFPNCVKVEYSFWICNDKIPSARTDTQCRLITQDTKSCTLETDKAEVQICNNQNFVLEKVKGGASEYTALIALKNTFGVDLNLRFFWPFSDGEDRRRIITQYDQEKWMCNVKKEAIPQSTVLKYKVTVAVSQVPENGPEPVDPVGTCIIPLFCNMNNK